MNRNAKDQCHFDAPDASNESAAESMTRFRYLSRQQPASFFGPFSTTC
jgi:hypothetical protein